MAVGRWAVVSMGVSDEQALLVGDVLATGFWAARISEITEDDTHRESK